MQECLLPRRVTFYYLSESKCADVLIAASSGYFQSSQQSLAVKAEQAVQMLGNCHFFCATYSWYSL